MYMGYKRIFWGIFFTTFHITVGSLQILPSFIGYLIIYSGIKQLREEFESANLQKAAHITIFATVVAFISGLLDLGLIGSFQYSAFSIAWLALVSITELLYIFYLLSGSVDLLRQKDLIGIAENYKQKTKLFIILYSLFAIAGIVGTTFNLNAALTIFAIAMIIIKIWLLTMVNTLKNADTKEFDNTLLSD
jgi:hypothetical protein